MLPSMMNLQGFTVKRFPRVLDHGTMVVDTTATPTTTAITGSLQPGTGTVERINRDGAEVVYTIFAKPADVQHFDMVTLPDGDYYVNGQPEQWGTGILNHTVIHLSRWLG